MSPIPTPSGEAILIVDDRPAVRSTLSSMLAAEGYSVTTASDVPSAAEALEVHGFAAIVTDLRMPGAPGLALVDEVERRGLRTPVILMSGSLGDLEPGDPRIDRLAGLLAKPISPENLLWVVRAATGSPRSRADGPRFTSEAAPTDRSEGKAGMIL